MVQRAGGTMAEQQLSPARQLMSASETLPLNSDPPIIYTSSDLLLSSPPISPEKLRQSPLKPSPLSFAVTVASPVVDDPVAQKDSLVTTVASPAPSRHNDLPSNQAEIDAVRERNSRLEIQLVEFGKELAGVQESEAVAQLVTMKLQDELEAVHHSREQLKTSLDASKEEVFLWKNKYEDSVEECRSLQSKIDGTASQAKLFDTAVDSLKADLSSAEHTIQSLSTQLATATQKDHTQTAQLAAAVEENAFLSRDNRRLTHDAAFLAQQLQQLTELLHKLTATPKKQASGGGIKEVCASLQERSLNISTQVTQPMKSYTPEAYASEPVGGVKPADSGTKGTESVTGAPSHAPSLPSVATTATQHASLPTRETPLANQPTQSNQTTHSAPGTSIASRAAVQCTTQPTTTTRNPNFSHFDSAKALMHKAAELEDTLTALNVERGSLEAELAHMPGGTAGRTGAQRRRKVEVEARLGELVKAISSVKRELKGIGAL